MGNRRNLANGTLSGDIISSDLELSLQPGEALNMPTVPFYATITPYGYISNIGNSEIVEVTGVTDDTLTIVRAQKGTTAKGFDAGAVFANGIYAEDIPTDSYISNLIAAAIAAYDVSKQLPVGSTYTNTVDGTNPATLLGYGEWELYGKGRVIVNKSDTGTFSTIGATPGAETHTLTQAQMPSHSHSGTTSMAGNHQHRISETYNLQGGANRSSLGGGSNVRWGDMHTGLAGVHNHEFTTSDAGSGSPHNNIQPSIVAYVWHRIA